MKLLEMNISGLVITYNEERFIGKCIQELFKLCDEVIIIDSFSSDKTVEIAESFGAIVIKQEFLGDGPQRVFGLQFCKNDWILNLDADEFLCKDAYDFILSKQFVNDSYDSYNFRILNHLGKKLIKHSGWYPDATCRFFNKNTAQPSDSKVHQRIISKNLKQTNLHINHYGWDSYAGLIAKKNTYTTWQAEQMKDKNIKVNSLSPIVHGLTTFIKCYFFKRGIFNGIEGLTFSLIQSFFSYIKYVKVLELKKVKST